jgi:hypothetical protein
MLRTFSEPRVNPLRACQEATMNPLRAVEELDGAVVIPKADRAWGPSGKLQVVNAGISGPNIVFDLLVPTSPSDVWDYIWKREQDCGSTDKVQLFQAAKRVTGSEVTALSREGPSPLYAPATYHQYRLTFSVASSAIAKDMPLEVCFFSDRGLMSAAVSNSGGDPQAT